MIGLRIFNLTGIRFGRLIVTGLSKKRGPQNKLRWHCRCDCGRETEPLGMSLRCGQTRSCGCGRVGGTNPARGKRPLTHERLRELLSYNPKTGIFRRRVAMGRNAAIGVIAGTLHPTYGYRVIRLDNRIYRGARLAWMYTHGKMPDRFIDHKNGVCDDDRIENLREANDSQNGANSRPKSCSPGHLKGAYFNKATGAWFSSIRVNRQNIRLGTFRTRKDAHAAYCVAAQKYFGEFARAA